MVYGQTEVTRDLMQLRAAAGLPTVYEAEQVSLHDFDGDGAQRALSPRRPGARARAATSSPAATATTASAGRACRPARSDLRAGLSVRLARRALGDAAGVARADLFEPRARLRPVQHARRRAAATTCSARPTSGPSTGATTRSGTSCGCASTARPRESLVTGPSIEKSIAPLRSFVAEPMRFGRLFLAGDAAHIVPPTGAKGLNLAAADVGLLSRALAEHYASTATPASTAIPSGACAASGSAERFSWWFTSLMHRFPRPATFGQKMQAAELDYLVASDRRVDRAGRELRRPASLATGTGRPPPLMSPKGSLRLPSPPLLRCGAAPCPWQPVPLGAAFGMGSVGCAAKRGYRRFEASASNPGDMSGAAHPAAPVPNPTDCQREQSLARRIRIAGHVARGIT